MGAAHSEDLRSRVVAEVAAGSSRRQAADRFRVSPASAVRWTKLEAQTGSVSAKPRLGKTSPLEAHADWLKDLVTKEPDLTLAEIELRLLDELDVKITERSIRRFFKRHGVSYKKNAARLRADAARRGASARALEGRPSRP